MTSDDVACKNASILQKALTCNSFPSISGKKDSTMDLSPFSGSARAVRIPSAKDCGWKVLATQAM